MQDHDLKALALRVEAVRERLDIAAQGRPYTLLAATKTQPAEVVNLLPSVGILDFGENRVQEWVEKNDFLDERLRYHHIGRLQSNKIKYIIRKVMLVHSVDRISLAQELNTQAHALDRQVGILLQVNPAGEEQKGGVLPDGLWELVEQCAGMPHLRVRGLMCMAPNTQDTACVHRTFASAYTLFDRLRSQMRSIDTLSMGMSQDAEIALQEGSNLVRLGSSLFGQRT